MAKGGTTWTFTYDANGMRTQRTNGTTTYKYIYIGSQLTQMTVGSNKLLLAYDANGTPLAVTYNGTAYYYVTNLQGDVVAILNTSGTAVVTYSYDAWGNILTTGGSMASTLGVINPLTYRGYVYDHETELYYLQSRYYNPEIGRFLNADALVSTGQGELGNNMFAYCGNNPVNRVDSAGQSWIVALIVVVVSGLLLSGCSSEPRNDLANANSLLDKSADELTALDKNSYNCYGNGIGKQIVADPTGYKPGDSTRKTFQAVKKDLGGDKNVRELDNINSPINDDEFRVAMKCGPTDYHFVRQLEDGTWYNKSGRTTGLLMPEEYIIDGPYGNNVWFGYSVEYGISLPMYTDETIYFAVKKGWDNH